MKRLLVLILISSIHSAYAIARVDDPGANCATKALPSPDKQAEVGEFEKLNNGIEEESLKKLANNICGIFSSAKQLKRDDLKTKINNLVLDHLDINDGNDHTQEIIHFWNKNSGKLVCNIKEDDVRNPQPVLKRAIAMQLFPEFFFSYLIAFGPNQIDFNSVEVINGERETVLDYIDKIMASEDFEENYVVQDVKRLRNTLASEFFKAKNAADLPQEN